MADAAETIALDVHAHLIPVDAESLRRFDGVLWDGQAGVLTIDGHRLGLPAIFDPAALTGWMDDNRVARALVSAPPPAYRAHLTGAECLDWTGYLNAGLDKAAAGHPDRLAALVHLPVHDPASAAAVARSAVARGRTGFAAPAGSPDLALGDPALDPLWSVLDEVGGFVFLHPGSCADGRLSAHYMGNLVGNPHETGLGASSLILAGVLERHPHLRVCLAHCGGSLPALAGRLQRGHDTARPGLDTRHSPPLAQARRFMADCIAHDEAALAHAEAVFGPDNILFGSDWPFPMGLPDPHRQLADHDPDRRRRILARQIDLT